MWSQLQSGCLCRDDLARLAPLWWNYTLNVRTFFTRYPEVRLGIESPANINMKSAVAVLPYSLGATINILFIFNSNLLAAASRDDKRWYRATEAAA